MKPATPSRFTEIYMLNIGIDLAPLTYTLTGIGVYLQQYLAAASKLDRSIHWHYPVRSVLPIEPWFRMRMSKNIPYDLHSRITIYPGFAFFHGRRMKNTNTHLSRGKMDLYHITNAQCQFDTFETPFVITVHDLAWKRLPKRELPTPKILGLQHLDSLINAADHVLCDSECTRTDVLEFTERKEDDVTTALLAPRPIFQPPTSDSDRESVRQIYNHGFPYFFSVSTIEPRKNYVRTAKAFAQFAKRHPDHRWIICGAKRSAWPDLKKTIERLCISEQVRFLGHASDSVVKQLIIGADALLYPSLYEGFGLPALEAMACGTPVVCSHAGSLGEVVGDVAMVVDPMSVESIFDGLRRITDLSTEQLLATRYRCQEHAGKFSWTTNAEKTVQTYRRVMAA